MIRISDLILYLFLFFFLSTGIYLIMINIGVSNTNLSLESKQDLANLNIYEANNQNPFQDNTQINYSLSEYSNTDPNAQSNIETKGALTSILDIFGDNSLTAVETPFIFINSMLPISSDAFNWTKIMLITLVGIIFFIAFIAAWKGGIW